MKPCLLTQNKERRTGTKKLAYCSRLSRFYYYLKSRKRTFSYSARLKKLKFEQLTLIKGQPHLIIPWKSSLSKAHKATLDYQCVLLYPFNKWCPYLNRIFRKTTNKRALDRLHCIHVAELKRVPFDERNPTLLRPWQ